MYREFLQLDLLRIPLHPAHSSMDPFFPLCTLGLLLQPYLQLGHLLGISP